MKTKHFIIIGIIFIAAALAAVIFKPEPKAQPLPAAQPYKPVEAPTPEEAIPMDPQSPAEVNLAVPFTSQAPMQIWDEAHGEFCEEASVLMAAAYIQGFKFPTPQSADQLLYKIKDWEDQTFGYYKDTTAAETARILTDHFGIKKVALVSDPSATQIKQILAEGKIIVLPAAGRQLGNPNYRSPGPLYHMLVIKGYTKDGKFITNDPGTLKGADYIFDANVIMNAMHDWNGGDVEHGQKVIIVVG